MAKKYRPKTFCAQCSAESDDAVFHQGIGTACPSPDAIALQTEMIRRGWKDYDHWRRSQFRIELRSNGKLCPIAGSIRGKDKEDEMIAWDPPVCPSRVDTEGD